MGDVMLRVGVMLAGLLLAAGAWSFPFEVAENIEGVEIAVDTMDLGDNNAAVSLENYGAVAAQCKVRFRSGPGVPVNRSARVGAGQKVHVTAGFSRQVIRMRVDVNCRPAQGGR